MKTKKLLKTGDVVLLLVLALGCVAWFWFQNRDNGRQTAVIYENGAVVQTIELGSVGEPYTIELQGEPKAVLQVEPGRIRYLTAECPDKQCVNSGWLSRAGDIAVCLPARTMVSVERAEDSPIMTY